MIKNPNLKRVAAIERALDRCDGYCPCVPNAIGNEDYKCPCKIFREEQKCCCQLYVMEE